MLSDFHKIREAAEKRPHEGAKVLIERAPECKSVYVSGFSDDTSKDQVQMFFESEVGALDPARGVVFSPLWDEEEQNKRCKRAIVYFKDKKSKYYSVNFYDLLFKIQLDKSLLDGLF